MKNIAVVGFGFMGFTHTLNIMKSDKLNLCAIVEKNPEIIEKNISGNIGNFATGNVSADDIRKANVYTSLDECLKKENLDAVHICVHTLMHYEAAKKVLEKGINLLLEKPMCLDLNQGRELIDIAKRNNLIFMVGHVVRFMPPYEILKDWIDSKKYGELEFIMLSRYTGLPSWGEWKHENVRHASGGGIFDLMIHDIDFMSYAVGEPSKIECFTLPGWMSSADYLNATWHFNDRDTKGIIQGGSIFHCSMPFEAKYLAKFSNASVEYCTKIPDTVLVATSDGIKEITPDSTMDGFQREVEYFADCLEKNQPPEKCMPESALHAVELCQMHIKE